MRLAYVNIHRILANYSYLCCNTYKNSSMSHLPNSKSYWYSYFFYQAIHLKLFKSLHNWSTYVCHCVCKNDCVSSEFQIWLLLLKLRQFRQFCMKSSKIVLKITVQSKCLVFTFYSKKWEGSLWLADKLSASAAGMMYISVRNKSNWNINFYESYKILGAWV